MRISMSALVVATTTLLLTPSARIEAQYAPGIFTQSTLLSATYNPEATADVDQWFRNRLGESGVASPFNFLEREVAEFRYGNNGSSGERELGINARVTCTPGLCGGGLPFAAGDRVRTSGAWERFVFTRTASAFSLMVGSQVIAGTSSGNSPINAVIFRTRSNSTSSVSSAAQFRDLSVNGTTIGTDVGSTSPLNTGSDLDYIMWVGSTDLTSFSIEGDIRLDFAGGNPGSSGLAAQIKTLQVSTVPEPTTWVLMLSGLAGLAAVARRRSAR